MRKIVSENHQPLVIAHRGASAFAPENTLAAFRLAIAMDVQGIELDVQLSADGIPVVMHDRTINRTTNRRGRVANFTAAELCELNAGYGFTRQLALRPRKRKIVETTLNDLNFQIDFSDEGVVKLADALSLLAPARLPRIYVEIKGEPATKKRLLETTIADVRSYKLEKVITLLSFDHQIIAEAKRLAPEIRTAATFATLVHRLPTRRSIIKTIRHIKADEAALQYSLATRRLVKSLHEQHIAVSVWTANRKMVLRKMMASGVDAIMTNYPNRLIELL
ncbi:MAG: glycerophosphodiester phosphodiesterase family protein [Acidobacteriota bacterium]